MPAIFLINCPSDILDSIKLVQSLTLQWLCDTAEPGFSHERTWSNLNELITFFQDHRCTFYFRFVDRIKEYEQKRFLHSFRSDSWPPPCLFKDSLKQYSTLVHSHHTRYHVNITAEMRMNHHINNIWSLNDGCTVVFVHWWIGNKLINCASQQMGCRQ